MDEDPFIGTQKGMEKVLMDSKTAFTHAKEEVFLSEKYKSCKVKIIPWEQRISFNSILIKKSSPYEPFLKQWVLDLYEKGIFKLLQQKWSLKKPLCEKPSIKPISPHKVIASFIWIIGGMILALLTFAVEKFCFRCTGGVTEKESNVNAKEAMKVKMVNFIDDIFEQDEITSKELVDMIGHALKEKLSKQSKL